MMTSERKIYAYTIGWKAKINGADYGNFCAYDTAPTEEQKREILEILKANVEDTCKLLGVSLDAPATFIFKEHTDDPLEQRVNR